MSQSESVTEGLDLAPIDGDPGEGYVSTDGFAPVSSAQGTANVVEIGWHTDRQPAPVPAPDLMPDEMRTIWPEAPLPGKSLLPRIGHTPPKLAGGAGVMVVALFGLNAMQVATAVRRIERQFRTVRSFRPLFLTDRPDTSVFRHAGFTYEYFAPAIYGGEDQKALFERRFLRLWRKWRGAYLIDFSVQGYLAARIENIDFFIQRDEFTKDRYDPRKKRPAAPPRPATTDIIALRAEYQASGMADEPDSFVLYRILGNDLPPRHEVGQTLNNLRFLLDNEPPLANCEKRWVINRVVDPEQEAAIIALLEERDQPYLRIPFLLEDYARTEWDLESFPDEAFFLRGRYGKMNDYDQLRAQAHLRRHKNNYVIHNNGARNAALRDGRDRAKWVLPWDGNCFLTEAAWQEIVDGVTQQPYLKYFTVPMSRTLDNDDLLDAAYRPEADEEPQILFRRDAQEEFDESFYYGRRPKVELFYRLGIPGKWDSWPDDVWDRPRANRSADAGTTGDVGWVARLFSGQKALEADKTTGLRSRGEARISAITQMLDRLDVEAAKLVYDPKALVAYDESTLAALAEAEPTSPEGRLHARLIQEADLALQRGPYSVVDKTALPLSGDRHDYFHPAPYWWPNPATPNGMPFLFRDGERIPGTRLYEPESERYDRTRLQRMFDETTTLALAWLASGTDAYAIHAATLIRTWFLDEATRMNPHLLYSQVRSQTPNDHGAKSGLIEMKDIYYLLDAVRVVERAGKLSTDEQEALREWLKEYLEWLQSSEQGVAEHLTNNNHGTCFDLQTGSIAAFLGDGALLKETFRTSRERILEQFTKEGRQPHEMKRTQTAHYCCFNLQCWINLATLAEACGDDLWNFEGPDGRGLARAFSWLLPHLSQKTWKYQQIEPFDRSRFLPLFFAARDRLADGAAVRLAHATQARPLFFPHDGIKPFWMLTRAPRERGKTQAWAELSAKMQKLEAPVFELCHGSGFTSTGEADIRSLDKKLWGGFSGPARIELESIRDDARTDMKEVNRAARTLARWSFTEGDYAETLKNAQTMQKLGVPAERERTLLRAYCLDRLGDHAAAADILKASLAYFPQDASLCLSMVNICRGQIQTDSSGQRHGSLDWLNRIYRNAGLMELSGEFEESGPYWPEPSGGDTVAGEAPVVTVLLTVPPGARYVDAALMSVRDQTWRNLQIIVADYSQDTTVQQLLAEHVNEDSRVTVVQVTAGSAEYQARNQALAKAAGQYVTVHKTNEIAHPAKIERHVAALRTGSDIGSISQHIQISPDGQIVAGWFPEFAMLGDNSASLMLETEVLQAHGGWDAVTSDPDAFLLWRLKRRSDKPSLRTVLPGVPLAHTLIDDPHTGEPTHLDFPYGQRRDELRGLLRLSRDLPGPEGADAQDTVAIPPLETPVLARPDSFETLLIGDFSEGADAIDNIRAHIETRLSDLGRVGLFHWPDYHRTWSAPLDDGIAALIDAGRLHQVSAFAPLTAGRTILCNPYIIINQIDGAPNIADSKLTVLSGPELISAEFFDGQPRPMPTMSDIEAVLGTHGAWATL